MDTGSNPHDLDPEGFEGMPPEPFGAAPPPPSAKADERCDVRAATGADAGLHCPFAGVEFDPGERVAVCRICGAVHLEQSWLENRGCATYGCVNAPDFRKDAMVIEPAAPAPSAAPASLRETPPAPPPLPGRGPAPAGAVYPVPPTSIVGPIIVTLCCSLLGWISLMFALKANTFRLEGRWDQARSARSTALTMLWVTAGLLLLVVGFYVIVLFSLVAAGEL